MINYRSNDVLINPKFEGDLTTRFHSGAEPKPRICATTIIGSTDEKIETGILFYDMLDA